MTGDTEEGGGGTPKEPPVMKLDQFLKWSGVTGSGGQAKVLIQSGVVKVNGEIETRRGRKLRTGDRVEIDGRVLVVGEADRAGSDLPDPGSGAPR